MKLKLIKTEVNYLLEDDKGVVIASTSLKKGLGLSKQNCDEIFGVVDVEKLAEEWVFETNGHKWSNNDDTAGDNFGSYREGFNKAMELTATKIFTMKDMMDCWNTALKFQENQITLGEFIKSLRPTEIEVEIEMVKVVDKTKVVGAVKGVKGSGHKIKTYKSVPKLDEKGCLILKKIEQ